MSKVLDYKPNGVITLYDKGLSDALQGEMNFVEKVEQTVDDVASKQAHDWEVKKKLITKMVVRSKAKKFQKASTLSFLTALIGISLLVLPLWIGGNIQANQAERGLSDFATVYKNAPKTDALNTDPVIDQFVIKIPKIDLESEVLPNVDPTNETEYKGKLLEYGIAHAKGSYLPGDAGMVYLFAHSTDSIYDIQRFNAKFFYINNLEVGDEIVINFKGKKFTYKVKEKKIINPNELDTIRNIEANLVLQTCWPLGTSWQRLLIIADVVETK